jgi:hypothetical protein
MLFHPLFPLWLSAATAALAQQPGTFEQVGSTLVSAMMVRSETALCITLSHLFLTDVRGQPGQGLYP